ncbi:MAG: 1-(5-phosphoribosyl)-5-[(5-phosphoribosylamino)methylideneamino]imidazole-4-carboxamide isomerase [Nitrospirota bacterium]
MIIIPAIDIKDGRCVRLKQGRMNNETIYYHNPLDAAMRWIDMGASILHIVDLDGAVSGLPKNIETIKAIVQGIDIPVEVGGGIRDMDTIERYLSLGVKRIVLGTSILRDDGLVREACNYFPEKIIAGIDAKDGMAAVKGWMEVTEERAIDLVKRMEDLGVKAIIFTDIKRDGMLKGPNLDSISEMADAVDIPIIASGGISTLDDIKRLKSINGVEGIIIGKAIYAGEIDLREAIKLAEDNNGC